MTPAFPFRLITGRSLYQFNAGTMTGRTKNIELRPTDVLDISSVDADRLAIRDGDLVRVVSRYGAAVLPAWSMARFDPDSSLPHFSARTCA